MAAQQITLLTSEQLAAMPKEATAQYLATLEEDGTDIDHLYQADALESKELVDTFYENNFMRFTNFGKDVYALTKYSEHPNLAGISRASNIYEEYYNDSLNREEYGILSRYVLFGSQISFYVYRVHQLLELIDEVNMSIRRADDDPSRETEGDFFSSEQIIRLYDDDHARVPPFIEAHHRRIVNQRRTHVLLRQAAYHTNDPKIQEELMARNIR